VINSNIKTYAFILGRERELCLAELKSVLTRFSFCFSISSVSDNVALFNIDADEESVGKLIKFLGGTVKIFRIMNEELGIRGFKEQIDNYIRSNHKEGKVNYGISSYTKEFNQRSVNNLGLSIKKDLKKDFSLRFVEAREGSELSSIASLKNKLDKDGFEFGIFADNSVGVLIGLTDAEEWNERDYGKPAGDKRSGMLPPKLARIMVNLALGQATVSRDKYHVSGDPTHNTKYISHNTGILLVDPFCGSGNIVLEAMILGCDVFGSDVSEKAVNDSRKNVEWLKNCVIPAKAGIQNLDLRVKSEDDNVRIIQADAAAPALLKSLNSLFLIHNSYHDFVVVTEPYLGEPKKFNPTYNATAGEYFKIKELYLAFLKNFTTLVIPAEAEILSDKAPDQVRGDAKNVVFCVVFPLVETAEGKQFSLYNESVDEIKKIGYTELRSPLIYGRDYQVVKREIVLLTMDSECPNSQ